MDGWVDRQQIDRTEHKNIRFIYFHLSWILTGRQVFLVCRLTNSSSKELFSTNSFWDQVAVTDSNICKAHKKE